MADGTSDAVENATLERDAAAWLEERADELDVTPGELLERLVAAYRTAEAGGVAADVVTSDDLDERLAALESELDAVASELEAVEADLESVDDEFAEKIQDVRDRVIQVKREADANAPADHDHPELAEQTADALDAVDDLEAEFADVAGTVRRLSNRVDGGFENFEEVLRYLRNETDGLDRKLTTLATAVLAMRESVASVAAANARRERADSLKRMANRERVRVADCEACESEVTVSLLTAPECPACGATFEGVDPTQGWFGSHTLVTGSAPALTSGEPGTEDDDDAWLGADTATLEEMASGDTDGDDGPEIVEPTEIEEPDVEKQGVADDGPDEQRHDDQPSGPGDGGQPTGGVSDGEAFNVDDGALDFDDEAMNLDEGSVNVTDEELDLEDTGFDFGNGADSDETSDGGDTNA